MDVSYLFLQGAPGCLTGLTIVVTGVLESLHREEAEGLVKKYGGKAPKTVSKNTSYLLAGDDAGPSKLTKVSPSPGPSLMLSMHPKQNHKRQLLLIQETVASDSRAHSASFFAHSFLKTQCCRWILLKLLNAW
jgi:hypothetical protein